MALHDVVENIIHSLRYREVGPHLRPCEVLADLGCGRDYRFLRRFRGIAIKCWGIDIVAPNKDDGNIAVRTGNIAKPLPFDDASLDQIACLAVLEHIAAPLPVLKECRRILKPGGRLILTTPSKTGIYVHEAIRWMGLVRDVEEGEHQDFAMSKERLEDWVKRSGFDIEVAYAFEFGMNLLVVARRPR